jgi:hypothetical protein
MLWDIIRLLKSLFWVPNINIIKKDKRSDSYYSRDARSAANRLKVAINYAKLGNNMQYLGKFFLTNCLKALENQGKSKR